MTLPASFGTITVTGKYVDFLGAAASGTITFTPPANVFLKATDVRVMIVPKAVTVTLDAEGAFSVTLPVTDDPDVVPAFTYAVQEVIGTVRRNYNVEIPHALAGPVDLSDLAPTGSVTVGTTALTKAVADSLYAPIGGGGLTSVASTDITDSTTTGRSLLTATDAATARTAIGAGTSSLALGTTASTAKAGNYAPTAANITDASTVGRSVLTAADAATARTAIGAGTSNLAVGTTSSTAKAGDYQPAAANITDATTTGRAVLTTASAAAARTTLGLGTSATQDSTAFDTAGAASNAVTTHVAATDPHSQYQTKVVNGLTLSPVYTVAKGAAAPAGLPDGTVIVELDV